MTSRIVDKPDRITTIDQEVAKSKRRERHKFRGQMVELPVVRLDIALPVYRIKNGRTTVGQYRYIEDHQRDKRFFQDSEEDLSVQVAQESILIELSKDSRASIFNELAHVAEQTESLLLTSHGSTLNGNRRLAAMRKLFYADPDKYSTFSHVDAAILPKEAHESDLELLEAELQLSPETRLEYGWIERRLKLRHQVHELNIDRARIKSTYRMRDQEINIELNQLALVEEYLSKYLDKPRAYEEVANSEEVFKRLEKSLRTRQGPDSEARRTLGFLLVKEARHLGDRAYSFIPLFDKKFSTFAKKFANAEKVKLPQIDQATSMPSDSTDPLAGLPTGLPAGTHSDATLDYSVITERLRKQSDTQRIGRLVSEIHAQMKSEANQQSSGEAALKAAERVNVLLQEIDLSTADSSTLRGIAAQLRTAVNRAGDLEREVQGRIGKSEGTIQ